MHPLSSIKAISYFMLGVVRGGNWVMNTSPYDKLLDPFNAFETFGFLCLSICITFLFLFYISLDSQKRPSHEER